MKVLNAFYIERAEDGVREARAIRAGGFSRLPISGHATFHTQPEPDCATCCAVALVLSDADYEAENGEAAR